MEKALSLESPEEDKPIPEAESGLGYLMSPISGPDSTVKVLIGEEPGAAEWNMHRALLMERAPFFCGALSNGFAESVTNVVRLPKERTLSFSIIVQWLYSTLSGSSDFLRVLEGLSIYVLVDTYYAAGRLMIGVLQIMIMNTLYQKPHTKSIRPACLYRMEEVAPDPCPLTELLLDQVAHGLVHSLITLEDPSDEIDIDDTAPQEWSEFFENGGWIPSSIVQRIGAQARLKRRRTLSEYMKGCKDESRSQRFYGHKRQRMENP
ncbi:hypothetical protein MMC18_008635 [Xylographa bjoerkii]|nr:hypothetical protein [Xylographa bjoerkii]